MKSGKYIPPHLRSALAPPTSQGVEVIDGVSVLESASLEQSEGLEFKSLPIPNTNSYSYSFWLTIHDRQIFNTMEDMNWIAVLLRGEKMERTPGIWLCPDSNLLHVKLDTDKAKNKGIEWSKGALPLNSATHVAVVVDNNSGYLTLYLNGFQDCSYNICFDKYGRRIMNFLPGSGSLFVNTNPWYHGSSSHFEHLQVFGTALTEEQVRDIMMRHAKPGFVPTRLPRFTRRRGAEYSIGGTTFETTTFDTLATANQRGVGASGVTRAQDVDNKEDDDDDNSSLASDMSFLTISSNAFGPDLALSDGKIGERMERDFFQGPRTANDIRSTLSAAVAVAAPDAANFPPPPPAEHRHPPNTSFVDVASSSQYETDGDSAQDSAGVVVPPLDTPSIFSGLLAERVVTQNVYRALTRE